MFRTGKHGKVYHAKKNIIQTHINSGNKILKRQQDPNDILHVKSKLRNGGLENADKRTPEQRIIDEKIEAEKSRKEVQEFLKKRNNMIGKVKFVPKDSFEQKLLNYNRKDWSYY